MIVATAGHVDHGKTSLVRALTGMDTDRLPEEKQRGMSIDLGFAHVDAGPAGSIGFIDVPGHARFVRNMLAGVAAIDHVLLVVAADDGPMPQTLEHLSIVTLLGVPGCSVVLTKTDRVPPQRVSQVQAEVVALLASGPYRGASVYPVALAGPDPAATAAGLNALRDHLLDLRRGQTGRDASGHFRMVVDRSFTRAGMGRVVTGTVLSGRVGVGDELILSPRGTVLRVRSVQVHKQSSDQAQAGTRCALNLAGTELRRAEPMRGDWLVAPPAHAPTGRIDARLVVPTHMARPLTQRSGLQLHLGAACVEARVATLDGPAIAPGHSGHVQLVLASPVAALRGDRFILRDPTQPLTLAGGVVLDPFAPARGRSSVARARIRRAWAEPDPAKALAALLEAQPEGLSLIRFAQACNLVASAAAVVAQAQDMRRLPEVDAGWAVSTPHWSALGHRVVDQLTAWHADHPDRLGLGTPALARRLGGPALARLLPALLADLVQQGTLARDGLSYRRQDHQPVLSQADGAMLHRVTDLLRKARLRAPIVGELVAQLGVDSAGMLDFLQRMAGLGHLVRVAPNRYYLPQGVAGLAAQARQLAQDSPTADFDAAQYRDRTGIGRNLTVQVLEFLDREGVTRFDGRRRRMPT